MWSRALKYPWISSGQGRCLPWASNPRRSVTGCLEAPRIVPLATARSTRERLSIPGSLRGISRISHCARAFPFISRSPGIPSEHRSRIFERFYRVDKARTRAEGGSGLGLSIAQWAVTVNGGRIEVQAAPGQGSIFRISLPRRAPVERAPHN